jgi:ACS family glucarate transporter-like MFS transporter
MQRAGEPETELTMPVTAETAREAPTAIRWRVMAALFLLSFVTIVDRVAISAAKNDMAVELRIPDITFGVVFGAFALGYALFMAPSGWLADRWGARKFLAATVACWSLFTLQTGLVSTVALLIAVRFLFGAAEAGAYPTAARALYGWLPARERGLALGLLNTGSRLGAAIGLTAVSASVAAFGWRASFLALGLLGFVWATWWYGWFRDDPREKRGVSQAELKLIGPAGAATPVGKGDTSWRELVTLDSALLLVQYFASNFTFFICFSWLLPYLRSRFALGLHEAAVWASVPLYCGALATWTSGMTVDAIYRRGRWSLSRRLPAICGFGVAAVTLLLAPHMNGVGGFVVCFAITTFGIDFTLSPSWSAASDLGGRRTGTLPAAMNTFGSIGSFASSVLFPVLLAWAGSIQTHFHLAAALDVAALCCWCGIHPEGRKK